MKAITLIVLLCSGFFASANPFTNSTSQPKGGTCSRAWQGEAPEDFVRADGTRWRNQRLGALISKTNPTDACTTTDYTYYVVADEFICAYDNAAAAVVCNMVGTSQTYATAFFRQTGVTTLACGFDSNGNQTTYTIENGGVCYDPFDLEANDSCDVGNFLLAEGNTAPNACATLNDGSSCLVTLDASSTFYDVQEGSCYSGAGNLPELNPNRQPPPPETCTMEGSGVLFCSMDGQLSNGFDDDKLCGTYDIGGGEQSICFDADENSNLVPNHRDPDIDGDGISNISDPTPLGDDLAPSPVVGGGSGGGGSGGGGSPTDPTDPTTPTDPTQNIDLTETNSLLAQVRNLLQDISPWFDDAPNPTQSIVQNIDQLAAAEQVAIDEFLAKDNTELGFQDIDPTTFDDLRNAFAVPDSCVNPVLMQQTIDLCSKAPELRSWLNYIFAFLTLIYIYREVSDTVSNK